MKTEKKCVALIGFMATGKTTIGSLLARELEYDFVDTDALVEAELGMKI
ncbi:MAG TPA: shikimate kinase I, partial [Acetobacterium sp.]|nr:shikimate kinase I [Acetobacterium sp.]